MISRIQAMRIKKSEHLDSPGWERIDG